MTFWELAYSRGWATKDQLKAAVMLGGNKGLTAAGYQQITGEPYTTSAKRMKKATT